MARPLPSRPPFRRGGVPLRFAALAISLLALLHTYVWFRLVHSLEPGFMAEVAGGLVVAAGGLSVVLALAARVAGRALPRVFTAGAFAWLGVWFIAFAASLATEPLHVLTAFAPPGVGRVLAAATGVGVAALVAYGWWSARRPAIHHVKVGVRGLDPRLEGFRIAQLSDVHVGNAIDRRFVLDLVRAVAREAPDLVVVTGDLVDGSVAELADDVAPLADLAAPHGVFFVTGNHEYYSGANEWIARLTEFGWRVLRNERIRVEARGAAFDLAGVDDVFGRMTPGHGFDLDRALDGRDPGVPVILLSHQPATIEAAAEAGVALQLSGHTHGGQIFPFHWAVRTQQPVLAGLATFGETSLFVHRGTGYWGPPFRIGARSEIAILELRRG